MILVRQKGLANLCEVNLKYIILNVFMNSTVKTKIILNASIWSQFCFLIPIVKLHVYKFSERLFKCQVILILKKVKNMYCLQAANECNIIYCEIIIFKINRV